MTANRVTYSPSPDFPAFPARTHGFWAWPQRNCATVPFVHVDTPDSGVSFGTLTRDDEIPKPVTTEMGKCRISQTLKMAMCNLHTTARANFRLLCAPIFFECFGTAILYLVGFAGTLSATANPSSSNLMAPLSWGLAVMLAIYASAHASGAHLNPGVSIMLATYGKFPWSKVLPYSFAQLVGAILGTAWAFCLQYQVLQAHMPKISFDNTEASVNLTRLITTQGLLYTKPNAHLTMPIALFNEFTASLLLGVAILALERNLLCKSCKSLAPLIIGSVITLLAIGFGANTSACLSPIRDLAPRLVAALVGGREGWKVFAWKESWNLWWLWGPFGADIAGIVVGAGCFKLGDKLCTWSADKAKVEDEEEKAGKRGWDGAADGLRSTTGRPGEVFRGKTRAVYIEYSDELE